MKKNFVNMIEVLLVILFPSLNVFLRDGWRSTAESHVFSLSLHGLGRLKDRARGLWRRLPRRP